MTPALIKQLRRALEGKLSSSDVGALAEGLRAQSPTDLGALRALAWLLHTFPAAQRHESEAEGALRRLVLQGDVEALYDLGRRLESSRPALAQSLLNRAIRAGVTEAMVHSAARMLAPDRTIGPRELAAAERLLQRAYRGGDRHAALWLGWKRDLFDPGDRWKEAARFYALAAEAGLVDGMINYGVCLERGLGVRADAARARRWYAKAAALGDAYAAELLQRLGARRRPRLQLVTAREGRPPPDGKRRPTP